MIPNEKINSGLKQRLFTLGNVVVKLRQDIEREFPCDYSFQQNIYKRLLETIELIDLIRINLYTEQPQDENKNAKICFVFDYSEKDSIIALLNMYNKKYESVSGTLEN